MVERLSKLVKKKDIDFDKQIVFNQPNIPKEVFEKEKQKLISMNREAYDSGKINDNMIFEQIKKTFMTKAIIENIKQHVKDDFHLYVHESDIKQVSDALIQQFPEIDKTKITDIAKSIIFENLLIDEITKDIAYHITEEQLDKYLDDMYQKSNISIREYKTNPEKLAALRNKIDHDKKIEAFVNQFRIGMIVPISSGKKKENN